MDLITQIWERATTTQEPPSGEVVLLTAGVALVCLLVPTLWHLTRHVLTIVHESAHATVAVLTGRRLAGVRLHSDTSGLTLSVGKPRGPGMIAMAFAGYTARVGFPPRHSSVAAGLSASSLSITASFPMPPANRWSLYRTGAVIDMP